MLKVDYFFIYEYLLIDKNQIKMNENVVEINITRENNLKKLLYSFGKIFRYITIEFYSMNDDWLNSKNDDDDIRFICRNDDKTKLLCMSIKNCEYFKIVCKTDTKITVPLADFTSVLDRVDDRHPVKIFVPGDRTDMLCFTYSDIDGENKSSEIKQADVPHFKTTDSMMDLQMICISPEDLCRVLTEIKTESNLVEISSDGNKVFLKYIDRNWKSQTKEISPNIETLRDYHSKPITSGVYRIDDILPYANILSLLQTYFHLGFSKTFPLYFMIGSLSYDITFNICNVDGNNS